MPLTRDESNSSMDTVSSSDTVSSTSTEADQFRGAVADLLESGVATEVYVKRALDLIKALGSRLNPNEFAPEWYKLCKARFDAILLAILQFAPVCGGKDGRRDERSQRYVACAIIASTRGTKASDDTHRALSELAISWFGNLLWMFKGNSSYKTQTLPVHSGEATPTLEITESLGLSGATEARSDAMRTRVLERQGHKCPLTDIADRKISGPRPTAVAKLRCAHILKRAVAVFPRSDSVSEQENSRYRFAMSTLDILAHYMAISHEEIIAIIQYIDSPANGIAMQSDYHDFFDDFDLCLIPADQDDVYTIKFYVNEKPAGISPLSEVIFRDHSETGIPLPNPAFIRLHAALCGILHVSGAGEDIDNIVKDLEKDGEGNGPPERIRSSGFQFLEHMEARASVRAMVGNFNTLVSVH